MPNPIRPLTDLASEAQETPMLPPTEIRRRGDRRRAGRRVGTVVAALALVATLGVGAFVVAPLLDDSTGPLWADPPAATPTAVGSSPSPTGDASSPNVSPTPTETTTSLEPSQAPVTPEPPALPVPPTWDSVATLEMVFPLDPVDWEDDPSHLPRLTDEYQGMGQSAKGLCDPGDWNEPSTVLVREFEMIGNPWPIYAIVLGYPDADAATAGYNKLEATARNCGPSIENAGLEPGMSEFDELDLPQGDISREPTRAAFAVALGIPPDSELGVWNETLLVQVGERVAWMVGPLEGMDHNCIVEDNDDAPQCPFVQSLPNVARQLGR